MFDAYVSFVQDRVDQRNRPDQADAVVRPLPDGEAVTGLDAKLTVFDDHADDAVACLIVWLQDHGDDLIALARGRHVEGHYRYGEKGLFEYDTAHLLAEAAQELADAIVYIARRAHLLDVLPSPNPVHPNEA